MYLGGGVTISNGQAQLTGAIYSAPKVVKCRWEDFFQQMMMMEIRFYFISDG